MQNFSRNGGCSRNFNYYSLKIKGTKIPFKKFNNTKNKQVKLIFNERAKQNGHPLQNLENYPCYLTNLS